jgi:hypothetical protein
VSLFPRGQNWISATCILALFLNRIAKVLEAAIALDDHSSGFLRAPLSSGRKRILNFKQTLFTIASKHCRWHPKGARAYLLSDPASVISTWTIEGAIRNPPPPMSVATP